MMNGMGTMMSWMVFVWLILIVLIILAVLAIIKWLRNSQDAEAPTGNQTPLDTLKQRYAKGEIDKEEFERIKKGIE